MSAITTDVDGNRGTPGRLIKVDHAGEFGAINIYRAQILLAHIVAPSLVPPLKEFLAHERRHLEVFRAVLDRRGIRRCRSFMFCGVGGYLLGLATGVLGRRGIMACTAAVESVVTAHLERQMAFMQASGDEEAYSAVRSILAEELEHQEAGVAQAQNSWLYKPIRFVVSRATELVIWLGLKL